MPFIGEIYICQFIILLTVKFRKPLTVCFTLNGIIRRELLIQIELFYLNKKFSSDDPVKGETGLLRVSKFDC